jgi:hypothetical protein
LDATGDDGSSLALRFPSAGVYVSGAAKNRSSVYARGCGLLSSFIVENDDSVMEDVPSSMFCRWMVVDKDTDWEKLMIAERSSVWTHALPVIAGLIEQGPSWRAQLPCPCQASTASTNRKLSNSVDIRHLTLTFADHHHQASSFSRFVTHTAISRQFPTIKFQHMDSSLHEVWQAAAGSPFVPTVGKGSQFLVAFVLLVLGFSLGGAFALSMSPAYPSLFAHPVMLTKALIDRSVVNLPVLAVPASLALA